MLRKLNGDRLGDTLISGPPDSLVTVLRPAPALAPEDSLGRALDVLRYGGLDTLPVVDSHGVLRGIMSLRDLGCLLEQQDESALQAPVHERMRTPGAVARARMSSREVRRQLAASRESMLVVVDDRQRYLGVVTVADLLAPMPVAPRPAMVGGMATPWGVYLTANGLQAGTGNLSLIASGFILGALLAAAHGVVGLAAWAMHHAGVSGFSALWEAPQPAGLSVRTAQWLLLRAAEVLTFLLLLRAIPLARYHAAEHQSVHALERGEPLVASIVSRMPRVHPRCGTNLMAAGLIFSVVYQAVAALKLGWLDASDGAILGAVAALFTWRGLGARLQQLFTTAPAGEKHLAAGIRSAEDLERKYLAAPPGRPSLVRRFWCMGMAQTFVGVMAGGASALYVLDTVFQHLR